jgi:hypothetical protein
VTLAPLEPCFKVPLIVQLLADAVDAICKTKINKALKIIDDMIFFFIDAYM